MENPEFDWKVNAKKAGMHALYAALAVLVLAAPDFLMHINYFLHPPGIFFVVPIQALLKSAGNWLSNH